MKITINCSDFRDAFRQAGREDQFSYEALGLIFEHLEDMERDMDEELELDVVAVCCEYAESTIEELIEYYPRICIEGEDPTDEEAIIDRLRYETFVIGQTDKGTVVYLQF